MARTPQDIDDAAMDGEAFDLDERRNRRIVAVRSRMVSPFPWTVTAGNRSTLNAFSSTSLSSRSSSVAMTSLRSGSVREPAAATIVRTTSVPTAEAATHAGRFEFHGSVCFQLGFKVGSVAVAFLKALGAPPQALSHRAIARRWAAALPINQLASISTAARADALPLAPTSPAPASQSPARRRQAKSPPSMPMLSVPPIIDAMLARPASIWRSVSSPTTRPLVRNAGVPIAGGGAGQHVERARLLDDRADVVESPRRPSIRRPDRAAR